MKKLLMTCISLGLLLMMIVPVTHGQGENLLTNPGFEAPYREVSEGRSVAEGWQPWNLQPGPNSPSYENVQPTYEATSPDTTRIRSGEDAQKYFTDLYFTHVGGVFQRVTEITPGTELRFSVYAYVWSSNQDDVDISEDPGGVTVEVGIDPTGGVDPTSSNIVWSVPVEQYDAYRQYSVIAETTSNAVTVFVRSSVDFPQRNNFVYLDDAVLEVTPDSVGQNPTNTPAPTDAPDPTDTPVPTSTPEQVVDDPTPTREGGGQQPTDPGPILASATPIPTAIPVIPTITPLPQGGPDPGPEFQSTIVHTVRRGDTVSRLAVLYGSTTEAIITANNLDENALIFVGQGLVIPVRLPAPATTTPSPTPQVVVVTATPQFGTGGPIAQVYIIRPGDTLAGIARRFNTTTLALAQANGIVNPNLIFAGQQLNIPGTPPSPGVPPTQPPPPAQPRTYVVAPGDNLYRISLRFGVSMLSLVEANNIANVNRIFAGQVLVIP